MSGLLDARFLNARTSLAHVPEKWETVFRKEHAQDKPHVPKKWEPFSASAREGGSAMPFSAMTARRRLG
jgi:hypothetical protein